MSTAHDRLNEAGKDIGWLKRQFADTDLTGDLIESLHLPVSADPDGDKLEVHFVYLNGQDDARLFTDYDLAKAHFMQGRGQDLPPEIRYKYKECGGGIELDL